MDLRNFTANSVSALQKAQATAQEYGNQEIKQVHLLYALIVAENGLIPLLFEKTGKNLSLMKSDLERAISALPKVRGGEGYLSSALTEARTEAQKRAEGMGDSFV
ncbi:MAG: type VI secretion system ATPase TssH, partial [Clostridia bacterium]|nr:type VI secretion system ATPase TssH [Clostridia bacterium]